MTHSRRQTPTSNDLKDSDQPTNGTTMGQTWTPGDFGPSLVFCVCRTVLFGLSVTPFKTDRGRRRWDCGSVRTREGGAVGPWGREKAGPSARWGARRRGRGPVRTPPCRCRPVCGSRVLTRGGRSVPRTPYRTGQGCDTDRNRHFRRHRHPDWRVVSPVRNGPRHRSSVTSLGTQWTLHDPRVSPRPSTGDSTRTPRLGLVVGCPHSQPETRSGVVLGRSWHLLCSKLPDPLSRFSDFTFTVVLYDFGCL